MGRIEFATHSAPDQSGELYNTAKDFFKPLTGREYYKTTGFKEFAFISGCAEKSYRETSVSLNRARCQDGATPFRSLQDFAESEVKKLQLHLDSKVSDILKENKFGENCKPLYTPLPEQQRADERELKEHALAVVKAAGHSDIEIEAIRKNPVPYETKEDAVNISADDVQVKAQKEKRMEGSEPETKRKIIKNTVLHVQHKL